MSTGSNGALIGFGSIFDFKAALALSFSWGERGESGRFWI